MSSTVRSVCVVMLCLVLVSLGGACYLGSGPPGGDFYGVRYEFWYVPGKGIVQCWTSPLSVPWIRGATVTFPKPAVGFRGFTMDGHFDLDSPDFGNFWFPATRFSSSRQFVDFNSNSSPDSQDAIIDWDSGNNAIKYTYPEPDGSNSVYVRGTYTYQAEDFLDLKLPYFSYNLELDPVVGDNWTYNKFWIRGTILPQIALGTFGSNEEIETRVDINNANNQDVTGALRFYRTGGTPWPIKIGETTSDEHPFTVKANSNLSLTLRSMDSAAAGWALAYGDKGLDFSASYTTKSEDKITHEAGFSGQLPGTFNVLGTKYDLSAGLDTAYAIVNPTTSTAQIHATYTPDGGTPIMKELTLMPMYSRPVFASDFFELSGSGSGSATFESYTDVTVSSLRTINGRQLSSLPGGRWQIGF